MPGAFLLLGLGNPGDRYIGSRHNVGFDCVDAVARAWGVSMKRAFLRPLQFAPNRASVVEDTVVLAKPLTYMNRSGNVLPWLMKRYRLRAEQVCVVVDNMDLPPGEVRMKRRGSASTHNGLRSISNTLGSDDYPRIYLGVGRPSSGGDVVQHVLGQFEPPERIAVDGAIDRVVDLFQNHTFTSLDQLIAAVNDRRRDIAG